MFSWFFYLVTPLIIWYSVFRFKRRHMYAMANKVISLRGDLPFLGICHKVLGNTEDIMNTMQLFSEFTTEAGGICKAWLGPLLYYIITDPAKLEVILKYSLEKAELHRFIKDLLGNASIFASVSSWRPRRKIAVPAFSPKILSSFVNIFSKQADKLSTSLKPMAGTGNFKIWSYINAYNLDAIMETAMGVQINAQDNHDNTIVAALNESLRLSCERIFHIWLQPNWLYRFLPQHTNLKYYTNVLHEFTDEIIRKKKEQLTLKDKQSVTGPDYIASDININFLDILINQSRGYSNLELREEVLTFILAAVDTSAASIGYILKLLGKYPEIQERVHDELNAVFQPSERQLHREDLPKLQYLERVIKETLRLFPPVPFIIRKAEKDISLGDGMTLPKGSDLIASLWGVHRNPKVWGPDAHCFDPDRFLPERLQNLPSCGYIPFSYGPRNCLGYQYAMMSMKTALSSILRRYRVVGEPEKGPIPHIRVKLEVMMKAVDDFEVALELR